MWSWNDESGSLTIFSFSRVDRYIARLIAMPLAATLALAAMLLLLDKMLRLFDFVVREGGPVTVVWRMLANLLPEYLSLGIPIGLMLGILLAFRKLALSSELDVLRGVGLGYGRLLRVPYFYAAVLMALNLFIVGYVQPYSRYAYEGLRFELRSGALGASIKVGEFNHLGKKMTLRVEESRAQGTDLRGIFLQTDGNDGKSLAVTADNGTFLATDDPDTIILRLHNGVLVHNAPGYVTPRILSFAAHDLPIDLPKMEAFRGRGDRDLERTIPELVKIGSNDKAPSLTRVASIANFNHRLVQVAVMLVLPLLAVALAVPPKRSSSALGVFLSIVIIVTTHKIFEYGEQMGALGRINPWAALWVPFAAFCAFCIWLYYRLAHVPGGQPLGNLDRAVTNAITRVLALLRRDPPKAEGRA